MTTIISTAVITGTAVYNSTLITAAKTIAMTSIQKTLITVALATVTGAGIYEDRQAAQLREKIKFSSNDRQHLNHSVKNVIE